MRFVRVDVLTAERPTWRGLFHTWAFWTAIPAGVLLIVFADRPAARTASAIYAATLLLVFGTSAAYHRLARTYRQRLIMQRLDHSMREHDQILDAFVKKNPELAAAAMARHLNNQMEMLKNAGEAAKGAKS